MYINSINIGVPAFKRLISTKEKDTPKSLKLTEMAPNKFGIFKSLQTTQSLRFTEVTTAEVSIF